MMSRMIDDEETLKDNGLIEIDGVNVAECDNFDDGECLNPTETVSDCEASRNCQYKQLKRLEAEKQDLIDYFELREGGMQEDIQYWKNKAQELYKELEQYKSEIMILRKGCDEEDCTATCPEIQRLSKELDNYRRLD